VVFKKRKESERGMEAKGTGQILTDWSNLDGLRTLDGEWRNDCFEDENDDEDEYDLESERGTGQIGKAKEGQVKGKAPPGVYVRLRRHRRQSDAVYKLRDSRSELMGAVSNDVVEQGFAHTPRPCVRRLLWTKIHARIRRVPGGRKSCSHLRMEKGRFTAGGRSLLRVKDTENKSERRKLSPRA
jgi:hypothetical protein